VQEHTDLINSIRAGKPLNEPQTVVSGGSFQACKGWWRLAGSPSVIGLERLQCLRLLAPLRSGAAIAELVVAQALRPSLEQEPLVRLALLPLRTHRVVSD
jgi:hypothetical protein